MSCCGGSGGARGSGLTLATIWDTPVRGSNVTTVGDAVKNVTSVNMPRDGVMAIIINAVAATEDGSDWAVFLIAEVIVTRSSGVMTLWSPVGPIAPSANNGPTSSTWRLEVTTGPDNILLSVAGAVGVTVKWSVHPAANYNQTQPPIT